MNVISAKKVAHADPIVRALEFRPCFLFCRRSI